MKKAAFKVVDEDHNLGEGLTETTPVAIEFENLTMHLKVNGGCVLEGVTGQFPASSLVALMGPSGGGKTTFMNALCGRATYGDVSGSVKINGRDGGVSDIPSLVGFVPQDDIMHADLTVHQNILYNGLLRLPADTPYEKVVDHTNEVVKVLGMTHIAHNLVGSPERRGISGGQKKRVNIGMELAALPAIIFMDEPTSGLDGAATVQLAGTLAKLRKSGLTIVCVIHQPRWGVYKEFTHLLLLGAGGKMCYCGAADLMDKYFQDIFFKLPERDNPADWMIDVVCGLAPRYTSKMLVEIDQTFEAPKDLFEIWTQGYKGKAHAYVKSPEWEDPKGELKPIETDRVTPGLCAQTMVLFKRNARQFDKSVFMTYCFLLFLTGLVFGQLTTNMVNDFTYDGIMPILTGTASIYYMIVTISARSVFGDERLQYLREFKSGTSAFGYWLAKNVFNIMVVVMFPFCFVITFYWMMPVPAQRFGDFFWIFMMATWYHTGLGMLISVTFSSNAISLLLCVFVPSVADVMLAGQMTKVGKMDGLLYGLSAFSCGRWFKNELWIAEIKEYPSHVLAFREVKKEFADLRTDIHSEGEGTFLLFLLGLIWRLYTLMMLLLLKYSEGGNTLTMLKYVISKYLSAAGLESLILGCLPKKDDCTGQHLHGTPMMNRKPSQMFKVDEPPPPEKEMEEVAA
jgi:ABC-type multidrug transport system ATPase subunit